MTISGPLPPGRRSRHRTRCTHDRKPQRGRSARAREDRRTGFLLISPTVVIVFTMVILPILWTISLAFQHVRLLNLRRTGFIGDYSLDNFENVLTSPGFVDALITTLVYSVGGTACAIGLGLVAALALRRPFRGRGLVRACMLVPYVAPVVAAAFVWTTMLNPQFGVVNHYGTSLLGWDEPIAFLSSGEPISVFGLDLHVSKSLATVVLFEGWRSFPFAFLFLTARIQAIPDTLEEAAIVDGATPTQRFRYIVLPQLLPTIAVLTVLRFIWTFNNFDDIYLLTGGGSGTQVVAVRVYDYLINRGDIGAAAAQALVLAAILAVLVARLPQAVRPLGGGGMTALTRDAFERRLFGVLRPVIIVFLLVICLFPFYYMVLLSFRPLDAVLQDPGALWPDLGDIDFGTYRDVLASQSDGGQGFLNFIKNSFLVAIGTVVLTLLVSIPGAYAVSRLEFFGRRQISAIFLGVYFFPAILLAIPLFVFFTRIEQRGTLTGLLVVYVAQVAAVSIYMLRNYFDTIPASLEEAAAIDGCTRIQAMRHISLPLAMPAIASNALFIFMIAWNEFLFALLFLVEKRDKWTVSLGLSQLAGSIEVPDHGPDGRFGDPDPADHRALLPQ